MFSVPDRIKRTAILTSTRSLPYAVRVQVREYLLERLELARARRAHLFIIGHPKSGNTWLRTMISHLYHVRFGLPQSLILKSDELANAQPGIPRFLVTNGHYSYEGVIERELAADRPDSELRHRRIVFLARHPADIAVSWYIQFTKRVSAAKREMINHRLAHRVDAETISRWEFVMHPELGVPALIEYLNRWENNLSKVPAAMITSYEELRQHPHRTLGRIVDFLGLGFDAEEVAEAIAFGSFENLRRLENEGFFRHGGFAKRKVKDEESFKVRRAKIHGYRDDLTPQQVARVDELIASRLSPSFGYGGVRATSQKRPA